MHKFLVVSYDDDQQQWFWDYIAAKTAQDAVALVCERDHTSLRLMRLHYHRYGASLVT